MVDHESEWAEIRTEIHVALLVRLIDYADRWRGVYAATHQRNEAECLEMTAAIGCARAILERAGPALPALTLPKESSYEDTYIHDYVGHAKCGDG